MEMESDEGSKEREILRDTDREWESEREREDERENIFWGLRSGKVKEQKLLDLFCAPKKLRLINDLLSLESRCARGDVVGS